MIRKKTDSPHIGLAGKRNAGKSSLLNFLTGQEIAIVSAEAGTTTDPVKKTMELNGLGPVVWVDTAGIDDSGTLGELRNKKSLETIKSLDLVLILFTSPTLSDEELGLINYCKKNRVAFLLIHSQADRYAISEEEKKQIITLVGSKIEEVSIHNPDCKEEVFRAIREKIPQSSSARKSLLKGIVRAGDTVLLVTPIDSSAPEGRLILPQVQTIRDILDLDATAILCKESQLKETFEKMHPKPSLVITDSQVFDFVNKTIPKEIALSSFSILLARAKGFFDDYIKGTQEIANLMDGDRILILESCTHHASCEDIGRIKLPALLRKYSGKKLEIDIVAGMSPIERELTDYQLVIQCGGCVVTSMQLASRLQPALDAKVAVSNYGMAIAYMTGIFERSIEIFSEH